MNAQELLDRVAENLSVRRSFGSAYERDGLLIIPVALVAGGGGGGEGPIKPPAAGSNSAIAATDAPPDGQPLMGAGGGFGGLVLPVGAYVVKGDQVRWVPAIDVTLIVLAGLGMVRLLVPLLKNRRRRNRA